MDKDKEKIKELKDYLNKRFEEATQLKEQTLILFAVRTLDGVEKILEMHENDKKDKET